MALRDEFEAITDVIAPEIGLSKIAVKAAVFLLILAVVGFVFWKLFLADGQAKRKSELVQAHAQSLVSGAQGNAGQAASNIVAGNAGKETIIHERTNTNYVEITKQPGAGDPVSDEVDAAFRRAVCMRSSAAGLPDCQRLQEAGPR